MNAPHISWLLLERFHLGEVSPDEAARVEAALAADAGLRARLAEIAADTWALPALPPPADAPAVPPVVPLRRRAMWAAPLLAAAIALFAVLVPSPSPMDALPGPQVQVKGGTLGLALVIERDGRVLTTPTHAQKGDRVGLRLSCPPGPNRWDAAVWHGGELAFPLAGGPIECANSVPLSGAFETDSDAPLVVCVGLGGIDRARLRSDGPTALGADTACVALD